MPVTSNGGEYIFTSPITLPTQGSGMASKTETISSTTESVTETKAKNPFSVAAQVTLQSFLTNTENGKVTTTTTSTPALYESTEEAITETTTSPISSELVNQNTQVGNGYQTGVTSRTTATPVAFFSEATKTTTVSSSTLSFPQYQSAEQNRKQDYTNEETTQSNQELTAETTTAATTTLAPETAGSATVLTATLSSLNNEVSNAYQVNANVYEISGVVENTPYQSIHGNPYINNPPSNVYQTYDNNIAISNTNFNALLPENTYQVNAGPYNINGVVYNEPSPITSSRQQTETATRMGTKQSATATLPASTIAPATTKTTTITTTPETSVSTTVVTSEGATQTEPIKKLGSESTVTTKETKESNIATGVTVTQYPVHQQNTINVSRQPKETFPLKAASHSSDQNSKKTASPTAASSGTSDLEQKLTTDKTPSTYGPTTSWYPEIATTISPTSNTKAKTTKEGSQNLGKENDASHIKVYDNANPSAEYSYESKPIQSPANISKELPYQDAPKLEVPFQKEDSTGIPITNFKVSTATTTTAALPYLTTTHAPLQTSAPHDTVANNEGISTTTTEETPTTPGPIFDQPQLYYATESTTAMAPETASNTPYLQDFTSTVTNLPDQSMITGTKYPEESTAEKNQSITTKSTEDSAVVSTQSPQSSTATIPQDVGDNNTYEAQKQEENINTQSQIHTSNSSYRLYGDNQNSQWQILNNQQQQDTTTTLAPLTTSQREETQKTNMAYTASPSEQAATLSGQETSTSSVKTNKPSSNTMKDLRTTEKPSVTPSTPNPVADSQKAQNTIITGIPKLTTSSKTESNEMSSQKIFEEINAVQNLIAPTKSPLYELVTNAAINIENAARRNDDSANIRRPTLSQLLMHRVKGPSMIYFSNPEQSSEPLQQDAPIEPDKNGPTENPKISNLQTAITPSKVTLKNLVSSFTTQASSTGSRKSQDEVQALARALATNEVDINFPTEADIYSQIEQYPTIKITKDLSKLNEDISETYEKRENIPSNIQHDNSLNFVKDDEHNDFGSTDDDQRGVLENEDIPKSNAVSQYVSDYDKDGMVEQAPFLHSSKQKIIMKENPALKKSLLSAVLKHPGQIHQRLTPRSITEHEMNTNYEDDQLMSRLRKDENIMDLPPANDDIDWGSELPVEAYLKNKEKTLRNYIPGIGAKTSRREQSMEVPYLNFLKKRYFPKTNKVNLDPDLDILPLDSNKY